MANRSLFRALPVLALVLVFLCRCSDPITYDIGGSVTGLTGNVVLQNNSTDDLSIKSNRNFTFSTKMKTGDRYDVTILTQPAGQTCTVSNDSGTVNNASVLNIKVMCEDNSTPDKPNVTLSVSPTSVAEDSGTPLIFTVTLDQASAANTSVKFSVSGTAIPGTDFTVTSSPLVIPAGHTTATITLTPISDISVEGDKTVAVTLHSSTGYTAVTPKTATATITNDDVAVGNFLYVQYDGTNFLESTDGTSYSVFSPPVTIINTDIVPLNVIFVGDFTINNNLAYLIAGSDDIRFGSQTLDSNGSPTTVTISNVSNYTGLIRNSGNHAIAVMNLFVNSDSSTLATNSGWIVQRNFASSIADNVVLNCASNGNIRSSGGGIVGNSANNLNISGCFSTGSININSAGGIVGNSSDDVTVANSYSTGAIGSVNNYNAGGIVGNNSTNCTITNSYSTGNIYGDNSGSNGGIVGANATNCTVTNSYSTGSMGLFSGGIFGPNADTSAATNSYSRGRIDSNAGGIFGSFATNSTATNSYSRGNIDTNGGGIFGSSVGNSTAINCFSTGSIGTSAGGVFGSNSNSSTATDCYTTGVGFNGIFGDNATGATTINDFAEDSGIWNDVNANSVLTSASWISAAANTPFEFLATMRSATPYSQVSVNDDGSGSLTLNNSFSETVEKGNSTISALNGYNTFSIVSINDVLPNNYPEISIDPASGQIFTTTDVAAGSYDIVVNCFGALGVNGHSTSVFNLTVNN